ncbi:hypothetical protein [Pseudoxanthomonas suwonensis]
MDAEFTDATTVPPGFGHNHVHCMLDITRAEMAKPNYSFEKRQRELAKKKKQDEKDAKKRAAKDAAKTGSEPAAQG